MSWTKGVFTQHLFQLKVENNECILAIHLHDSCVLVRWPSSAQQNEIKKANTTQQN